MPAPLINDEALRIRPDDHIRGGPDAPIQLLEYGDFQCPTCRQAAPVVELLLERHGDRILFAFRNYPLESIHPDALAAAEAAEEAALQGRFWEMHRLLFDNQSHLKPSDLEGYARQLHLDIERYRTDMREHRHEARIRRDIHSGEVARVRATPGFFVNGRAQDVSFGMQSLHDAMEEALRQTGT